MEQAIKYLRALRNMSPSSMHFGMTTVYVSPAQQLRNATDELERKGSLLREIDIFLSQHEKA